MIVETRYVLVDKDGHITDDKEKAVQFSVFEINENGEVERESLCFIKKDIKNDKNHQKLII